MVKYRTVMIINYTIKDFAKELWIKFPKLKLIDYGFHWEEDPKLKNSCSDNNNWFLFSKI